MVYFVVLALARMITSIAGLLVGRVLLVMHPPLIPNHVPDFRPKIISVSIGTLFGTWLSMGTVERRSQETP